MAQFNALNALVTVLFGAAAGGFTNMVAIWMLFHPYEARGPGRLKFQGAIPKNKARMAKTIGRTVGQRLITPGDMAEHLASPDLKDAFEGTLKRLVGAVLEQERGSLRNEMAPAFTTEIERTLHAISPVIAEKVQAFAASEEFKQTIANFIDKAKEELSDHSIGEILTTARRVAIRETAEDWVEELVTTEDFENAISGWLDRQLVNFANDHTPLLERLPIGLVAAVERAIAGYLPEALDKMGEALSNKKTRARIQSTMHDLFKKFVDDLMFHERIVARLVVTEKTISRMLDTFEKTGADKVAALLEQPEMREEIARSVNQAINNFLRRPLSHHVDYLGPERVIGIKDTVQENIVKGLRDPGTRAYAIDRLDQSLKGFESKTWGELLGHLPPDQAASLASDAASSNRVREWLEEAITKAVTGLLDKPIGKPKDWVDEDMVERITERLYPALWSWTQEQVPRIVAQIDVETMVEEKIHGFSLQKMEDLVKKVTQRELDVIVRLGFVLGALVGSTAYALTLFLPG